MVTIFAWLEKKGVKHIVKVRRLHLARGYAMLRDVDPLSLFQVIVDDLRSTPHSDEAIEDTLTPFVSQRLEVWAVPTVVTRGLTFSGHRDTRLAEAGS